MCRNKTGTWPVLFHIRQAIVSDFIFRPVQDRAKAPKTIEKIRPGFLLSGFIFSTFHFSFQAV